MKIESGKVGFFTKDIESISRSSPQEQAALEGKWKDEESRRKRVRSMASRDQSSRSTSIRYSKEVAGPELSDNQEEYDRKLEALRAKEDELTAWEDELEEKEKELYSLEKELKDKEDDLEDWEDKLKDQEYDLKVREREAPKTIYVGPGRELEGELISGGDHWKEK